MKFYAADKPDELLRVDMVHRYTHIVREGDRVITFQKSEEDARRAQLEIIEERNGIIRDMEDALNGIRTPAAKRIADIYGTSGLIAAAIRRQKRVRDNIRVVRLIIKE